LLLLYGHGANQLSAIVICEQDSEEISEKDLKAENLEEDSEKERESSSAENSKEDLEEILE